MKKIYFLFVIVLFLTGCSATANISIDKDSVIENIIVSEQDTNKYNKYKNWGGFPVPLYYDQELQAPLWMPNREKEKGVSYYDVVKNDSNKTIEITGKFTSKNHNRSSLVRNCFRFYNVINEGSKTIFSTSKGLTCAFKNFDIKVSTPYTVVTHNADKVDSENNVFTWKVNSSNSKNVGIYLEIDFSKKYNETETSYGDNNETSNQQKGENTSSTLIYIFIIVAIIILAVGGIYLYRRKQKVSSL